MRNKAIVAIVSCLLLILCEGCSSTGQARQFYTLHSAPVVGDVNPLVVAGGLGIGPVELPEFLSSNNIVTILNNQQVQKSQVQLWAGDLQKTISRTLATNLSQQLACDDVWSFPWDTRHRPEKQISILIEQLDGQLGKPVTLVVKWTLLGDSGQKVVAVGRQQYSATPTDGSYGNYVGAINDVINQFSKTLETEIRRQWPNEK